MVGLEKKDVSFFGIQDRRIDHFDSGVKQDALL